MSLAYGITFTLLSILALVFNRNAGRNRKAMERGER